MGNNRRLWIDCFLSQKSAIRGSLISLCGFDGCGVIMLDVLGGEFANINAVDEASMKKKILEIVFTNRL